jgi:hypothetical protein
MAPAVRFTHIVNPFTPKSGSEHERAQRITLASMRDAIEEATSAGLTVEALGAAFEIDAPAVAEPLRPTAPLERSAQDFPALAGVRPLPLLAEILARGAEEGAGDYLVFTNIDIGLQPHFYVAVDARLRRDERAGRATRPLVINRRTIADHYPGPEELDAMRADRGRRHPGFDCFVFPRAWVARMQLGDALVGAPWLGSLLVANLDALSGWRVTIERFAHLTFHLGDDKAWSSDTDLARHNIETATACIERLADDHGPAPRGCEFDRLRARAQGRPIPARPLRARLRRSSEKWRRLLVQA